ncbi:MAG TPA: hypothetical protein VF103_15625 [Polyangiaceae bacterium]
MWVSGSRLLLRALFALTIAGCGSQGAEPAPSGSARPIVHCTTGTMYPDADGDGYGASDTDAVPCESGILPDGFSTFGGDCDDSDPAAFRLYPRDGDDDGFGNYDDETCAGDAAPPGYLPQSAYSDCDDADPTLFYTSYVDADGDGYAAADAATVCVGDTAPPLTTPSTSYPGDCDDRDPNVRTLYYEDLDGDGYAASTDVSVCAAPGEPPPGFGSYVNTWVDCDDSRADVNVEALEEWTDGLDSDCDGNAMPYGCDDESCDPAAGEEPVDAECDGADLAVVDVAVQEECYETSWTVTVANRGTEDVPSFTLVVEAPSETLRYDVVDSLASGTRRSYPLSRWVRRLSGEVRFSVETPVPDCNAENDSLAKVGNPRDCTLPTGR